MADTAIDEATRKLGAGAFCKAMQKPMADVVEDERLFQEFGALWDCGTLSELRRCVEDANRIRAQDVTGILLQRARAAWLDTVSAQIGAADAPAKTQRRQRQPARAARY